MNKIKEGVSLRVLGIAMLTLYMTPLGGVVEIGFDADHTIFSLNGMQLFNMYPPASRLNEIDI